MVEVSSFIVIYDSCFILHYKSAAEASQKRIRFKTTTDASEEQVIQATKKITSHISNPSKFGKASKLAIQLFKAGSVRQATCDYFFAILEAAMASPSACTDPLLRADYQALFIAAQEVSEVPNFSLGYILNGYILVNVLSIQSIFTFYILLWPFNAILQVDTCLGFKPSLMVLLLLSKKCKVLPLCKPRFPLPENESHFLNGPSSYTIRLVG